MILDTLSHSARYESLHPLFAKAFAFLHKVDGTQALGRHDLEGDACFALVQTYETKPEAQALFEAHRKYIDVQFVYSGQESILWAPLAAMQEQTMAYDEAKEAALWKLLPAAKMTLLQMSAGHLAILFPQDAHAPSVMREKLETVFKVVVKVAVH